jgi:hypothetical protein
LTERKADEKGEGMETCCGACKKKGGGGKWREMKTERGRKTENQKGRDINMINTCK